MYLSRVLYGDRELPKQQRLQGSDRQRSPSITSIARSLRAVLRRKGYARGKGHIAKGNDSHFQQACIAASVQGLFMQVVFQIRLSRFAYTTLSVAKTLPPSRCPAVG